MSEFLKCRFCNSPFIKKKGKEWKYANDGSLPKQRYFCNECKKYFVFMPSHYIKPKKISKEIGEIIMILHKRGLSIRKIKQSLTEEIGNMTIWRFLKGNHTHKNFTTWTMKQKQSL